MSEIFSPDTNDQEYKIVFIKIENNWLNEK